MTGSQFHLQAHVDDLYANGPRRLALRAQTPHEFELWRAALRQAISHLLGIAGRTPPRSVQAVHLTSTDQGAYVEKKFALDVGESVSAPAYVLVPKGEPPYKPVLVFHGHNPSVQYILGNYPDPDTADHWRALDNNYAQRLAEAGYLVGVIAQRGFGERLSDQVIEAETFHSACRQLSFEYLLHGRTMLGERIWDALHLLSFIRARADVVPGVMGCTGNSGGGTTTLWLAALDDRITVAVPYCYFCSFKHSILGVQHCECNYVPGILTLAEMGDLAALIAPRPVRFIAGEHDPLFPIAATRQQFDTVQRAYDLLDAGERCSLAVHPDEHRYDVALSRAWFDRWL
ncbi:MAG: hypothetical protein GYB65_18425 [Chloroflexi bacterium]|nr:hypothetical protein [Chloroflexota bacterium]